ncbi:triose-phosphate isomerase [Candidatus Methylacidithermus pantelleriae]|uniref:Triosephosphate isomerase n=1 Tax=Candidatus Methylacidithermus pantelleriae TaxID=2744239 RepID=A0A8J2BMI5_9BACT|nr:triose-phosphate isomerase [Candidatus Methylacidithermus pantelleriae]CAF0692521.1 Triosephosphate isomerase [Candidatus Methylacidithermus pantelleriae]
MYRKKIIAGNWKMNKTVAEARVLAQSILAELRDFNGAEVVLCPPFTALSEVSRILSEASNVYLGAQNLHPAPYGAFTGEISAPMLRELFCHYVIVGHSERRRYFCETDAFIREKIRAALASGLRPILCIGESWEERKAGRWKEVLAHQLQEDLAGVSDEELPDIVIAYEPVWAIGTGENASPTEIEEAHRFIRSFLSELVSPEASQKTRIQYGGSVRPEIARDIFLQPNVDGALVGGASLEARSFTTIVFESCAREKAS